MSKYYTGIDSERVPHIGSIVYDLLSHLRRCCKCEAAATRKRTSQIIIGDVLYCDKHLHGECFEELQEAELVRACEDFLSKNTVRL